MKKTLAILAIAALAVMGTGMSTTMADDEKFAICHYDNGNDIPELIWVGSEGSRDAHLNNHEGDFLAYDSDGDETVDCLQADQ